MKKLIISLFTLSSALFANAQLTMSEQRGDFNLLGSTVLVSDNDYEVVRKTAGMFIADVKDVSGRSLPLGRSANCVIAGTIGHSEAIDALVKAGKINVADIQNAWERYHIQIVKNPMKGVKSALVIAGSDRRGTAYGLLHVSELIGQNPWCWWADVPAKKHSKVFISGRETSRTPSVKYRGIFINDEDWGLTPWAGKNFEKERGNIGPRTYAKVCELLLRLKANYLCPAMHPVSTSFYSVPENKLVADSFAIVMGTSHCEPLFLNTASDWNRSTMGEWDYDRNKQGILSVLDKRVKETIPYENVYTLALRGLHDAHMNGGGVTMKEKVNLLQGALQDQRNLIAQNTSTPINEVPQAFTPYKEVLDIYSAGLELPEDVTIIWPDDNFGYMKRLSNPKEQQRSGRSGVYYHLSYLGVPHSYLWFGTTAPALMYEELKKAYDTTADRIWVANSGDIKGTEASIALFLDMAYDIDSFNRDNVTDYHARWYANMFGEEYYEDFRNITREQYRLCFQRKPEYMGWGYWNNFWGPGGGEKRTDTEFSLSNYREFEQRLSDYQYIADKTEEIYSRVGEKARPAFFELMYYPVKGAELMNRMNMGGQLYREYVRQERASASDVKTAVEALHDSLVTMTRHYNDMLDGKWRYVMSLEQNYDGSAAYFKVPRMEMDYKPLPTATLGVKAEGETADRAMSAYRQLPVFSKYSPESHWIDVYNKGVGNLNPILTASAPWITITQDEVTPTALVTRVASALRYNVSVDWDKVPVGEAVKGSITVKNGGDTEEVLLSVFNPAKPAAAELQGMFVEHDGYVAIPAADYTRKIETDQMKFFIADGLGICGRGLQMGEPTQPLQPYRTVDQGGRVEYDFYCFNAGVVDVYTYVLPTFPLHSERDFKMPENTNSDTKYSVRIDDGSLSSPTTSAIEYTHAWYDSILRNCRVNKSTLYIHEPGRHTLQIRPGDPGVVVQKIVIDFGGVKKSYLGGK